MKMYLQTFIHSVLQTLKMLMLKQVTHIYLKQIGDIFFISHRKISDSFALNWYLVRVGYKIINMY